MTVAGGRNGPQRRALRQMLAYALGSPEQKRQLVQAEWGAGVPAAAFAIADGSRQVHSVHLPVTGRGQGYADGIGVARLLQGWGRDTPALVRVGEIHHLADIILQETSALFQRVVSHDVLPVQGATVAVT